ncbi:DUF6182 family protein [Streptomyces sp. NPDC051315]|uniref:DUF6182 family protein n=1 Tax=Streptomyces sp. NPDC051315 TaxID=3365650 RepID=UPI003795DB66
MTSTQRALREHTAARIRSARPGLGARHDLTTHDGLVAAQHHITAEEPADEQAQVVVVIGDLDLAHWARDTCAFALGLPPGPAAAWRASFTRTVFLAGNPRNLRDRFAFAHVGDGHRTAWTAPGPAADTASLRRLLKLLHAPAGLPPAPAEHIGVPGAPRPGRAPARHGVYLATAGCGVAEALVHLNHLLVEAVLDGLIAPGDHLTLHRVPRIVGLPRPAVRVRAVPEPHLPGRLRAAAALTQEADHA